MFPVNAARIATHLVLIAWLGCSCVTRAQSPLDSTWTLDHGDTLLFHHDGTREFVRANGSREVRFPDQRRLYFFTPDHFLSKGAFLAHNFEEVNAVGVPARSDIRMRLASGYAAPNIMWASFPGGAPNTSSPTGAPKNHEYRFKLAFDEPGWQIVEISATGPGHVIQLIARILVCVGDHLPMPFDTTVERHGPATMPRTDLRIYTFLTYDRDRTGPPLLHDSIRDETASLLVASATQQHLRWALIAPAKARAMLGAAAGLCDTAVMMVVIASGHTPEALAWNVLTSPTLRSLEIVKHARRVAVAVTRVGSDVVSALLFRNAP